MAGGGRAGAVVRGWHGAGGGGEPGQDPQQTQQKQP
eukprot:COSAG01_NODE_10451_length_2162_cov_6.561318_1_plen_35_part_10